MAFYSPCQCGKFEPREVTSSFFYCQKKREHYQIVIVTVCSHCGRHEPKREKPCN